MKNFFFSQGGKLFFIGKLNNSHYATVFSRLVQTCAAANVPQARA